MGYYIITGINGGIGLAVAKRLLDSGSHVVGIDLSMNKVLEELAEYKEKCALYEADLMQISELDNLVKYIIKQHGAADGFVHCAGFDKMSPIYLTKTEDIQNLWTIHALVPMRMITLLSKKGNMSKGASIVLISSISAHEGAMGHTAYAAAKGAIEGYLAPAAAELMERNIRLNEVVFGPVMTEMSAGWMSKLDENARNELEKSYPLGLGTVDSAASLICYLLSDEAGWITGQKFVADGGHMCRRS